MHILGKGKQPIVYDLGTIHQTYAKVTAAKKGIRKYFQFEYESVGNVLGKREPKRQRLNS